MTATPSQASIIDANFLREALEEHRKAEEDGTLYMRTRPRVGMLARKPQEEPIASESSPEDIVDAIKALKETPLPEYTKLLRENIPLPKKEHTEE